LAAANSDGVCRRLGGSEGKWEGGRAVDEAHMRAGGRVGELVYWR